MRIPSWVAGALLGFGAACGNPQPRTGPPTPVLAGEWRVGDPVEVANLTLFPLHVEEESPAEEVLTFDEALERGSVRVREVEGGGGDVNALEIENRGDRQVLLLGGEIVQGGKQDRMIGQDVAIGPRESRSIPVFCVEPGRWCFREPSPGPSPAGGLSLDSLESAGGMAHPSLRYEGQVEKDQQRVWEEVRAANEKVDAPSASASYAAFALNAPVEPGSGGRGGPEEPLGRALEGPRVVGFVAFLGGKPVAADAFASPSLFARYREKLLRSYVAQTRIGGGEPGPAPTREAAASFLQDARKGAKRTEETSGLRTLVRRESSSAVALECYARGGARPEHLNVVSK